jgi:hypothetical protein
LRCLHSWQAAGHLFNAAFAELTTDQKVVALRSGVPGLYLADSLPEHREAILTDIAIKLAQAMEPYEDSFDDNIAELLHVQRVDGEMLTATNTALGNFLRIFASQIADPEQVYQIGDASDEGKHSPALHALLALTDQSTSAKFETLLRGDQILRYSIVGEPNGVYAPELNGVSGPLDHGRVGPSNDPSKLLSVGSNSYLMENLLWKAYDSGENNLYDYFYKFFKDVASSGAAGVGMSADSRVKGSVHDAVVKLALQVLRDAQQNTDTLQEVKVNLGNTWNFGGGDTSGIPFSDKVVLRLSQISASFVGQKEQLNGGPAQKFGVREINTAVADAVAADLIASGGQLASALVTKILGATTSEIRDGSKELSSPWEILVVQAGGDNPLSYDAKQTSVAADATASHVIIGGSKTTT